ncbi:hypothetical protein ACLB2K_027438 [Fragaria x ananassa]
MGKRKSRSKPVKRRAEKLARDCFQLPFCNYGRNVQCRIYKVKLASGGEKWIGTADCYICHEVFHTQATALTEPIDIYSEWIDECERVNNELLDKCEPANKRYRSEEGRI